MLYFRRQKVVLAYILSKVKENLDLKRSHTLLVILVILGNASFGARNRLRRSPSTTSPDAMQKIFLIEHSQQVDDPYLGIALRSSSPSVVEAALTAIGRLGVTQYLEEQARFLTRRSVSLNRHAAWSLGLLGNDVAAQILMQNVPMKSDLNAQTAILRALALSKRPAARSVFEGFLHNASPDLLSSAATGLGILWSDSDPMDASPAILNRLLELASLADPVATRAAFALVRYKGIWKDGGNAVEAAISKTHSESALAQLCRALPRLPGDHSSALLARLNHSSLPVQVEAIRALKHYHASTSWNGPVRIALKESRSAALTEILALVASQGSKMSQFTDTVKRISKEHHSIWVRGVALRTLARIHPPTGRKAVLDILAKKEDPLLPYAVNAMPLYATQEDIDKLSSYFEHPNLQVAEEAIESVHLLSPERLNAEHRSKLKAVLQRGDVGLTTIICQLVQQFRWRDFIPTLVQLYPSFRKDQIEAKLSIIETLAILGDRGGVPLLERAISDEHRLVGEAAAKGLLQTTGRDEKARVPMSSKFPHPPVQYGTARSAAGKRIAIETTRGTIVIRLFPDAPLTSYLFLDRVRKGFYDHKTFHRVIPNFVVQGGDPRGDGYGGPGIITPDEISIRSNERGLVAIASAGKDTNGCQFFINLGPNYHLDGKYTIFAEVVRGMDVADRLEIGDEIKRAYVQ